MYNEQVTNLKLAKIQSTLNFKLKEYDISKSVELTEDINSLIDMDLYRETAKLGKKNVQIKFISNQAKRIFESKDVQQFIQNERIICKWNCWYFLDRYYRILDASGKEVLYSEAKTIGQRINERIFSKLQAKGSAIRKWTPKARQQGETKFSQGVVLQRNNFFKNTKTCISSKTEDDTRKLASDNILFSFDKLPFWNREFYEAYDAKDFYRLTNNSLIDYGWGTQKEIGRGGTYQVAHITEIASFKHPRQALDSSLLAAMHEFPELLQLFEGTANGRGKDNYYHSKTLEIKSQMDRGLTSIYLTFFPYFIRRELYPTDAWIRARGEAFSKWKPSIESIAHAKAAENTVRDSPDLLEELDSNWIMPRETLFWYEVNRQEALNTNRLNEFLQEYPANLEEAFQHAGKGVYPIQLVTIYNNEAQSNSPDVYKIRGDESEINRKFFPNEEDELDYNKPIIEIRANWNTSIPASYYELVPIKFKGWERFDPINKFLIWEHPNTKANYCGAFDPSDGLGINISNDAALEIWKGGTVEYKDKQVCEFASPEITQMNMWPFMLAIFTYFSPIYQLLAAIEINNKYELQNAMIQRGWSNLYKRYDEGKMGQDLSKIQQYGVLTSPTIRQSFIEHFSGLFLGQHIEAYSIPLIGEIKDLHKVRTISPVLGQSNEKILGSVDNRFMASCIALYSLHRDAIMGFEKKSWEERSKRENSVIELKSFNKQYNNITNELDNPYGEEYDKFLEIYNHLTEDETYYF